MSSIYYYNKNALWYVNYIDLLLFIGILKNLNGYRCLAKLEVLLEYLENSTSVTKQHNKQTVRLIGTGHFGANRIKNSKIHHY